MKCSYALHGKITLENLQTGATRKSFKCGAEKKTNASANANAHDHKTDAEKAGTRYFSLHKNFT